jgi:hypothetical protein
MNNQCIPRGVVSLAIYSALASHDPQAAQAWNEQYQEPQDQTITGQIQSANRFWRCLLGQLPISTVSVRDYLIDQIELQDWLRLFATQVLPVALAFSVPRSAALCAA